jgi:ATP-dependent Clp protease adaptor protein ClpS
VDEYGRRLPRKEVLPKCVKLASGLRMAKVKEVPENSTRNKPALEQPWNVVVHNDPVNLMVYVTLIFRKVFGFSREKAESHMLEVHHRGRSIVWSGARERAEFYVQQLHSHLLLATIEQSES